jgi:gamma-glutamylcyclotransferase (GGCT)/AIG2-like uncharacterized protein YtfP
MNRFLFVYGTLQVGRAAPEVEPLVKQFRHVDKATVHGILYDLGDYPAAVLVPTESKISGEVLELPPDPLVLRQLDEYEGYDPQRPDQSLFTRVLHPVLLDSGETLTCWIYVYNRDPGRAPKRS